MHEAATADLLNRQSRLVIGAMLFLCAIAVQVLMMTKTAAADSSGAGTSNATSLETALAETALERGYVPVTADQVERATEVFARLLAGEAGEHVESELATLGLELDKIEAGNETLTLVRETSERLEGKGAYVFRQKGKPILLQAPHRFKDLETGKIVAKLMEEGPFRAAAWNTVPRWYEEDGVRIDADLAHAEVSIFNAFAIAFARTCPGDCVVQLHGFDRANRSTPEGKMASVIVSSGTETPSDMARGLAVCLSEKLAPQPVLLYPDEVTELGGTTNENGRALRASGLGGFIHVELAREIRRRLVEEPVLRGQVADCMASL